MDLNNDYRDNCDASLFRFSTINDSNNNHFQNFLLFILDSFYEQNYGRYNGYIYQMTFTDNLLPTYSWKRIDSISNVIYSLIKKEVNYDQFLNATNRGDSVKQAAEFLRNCEDSQFREIKKDRHVFSFRNGIYFAKTDTFMSYNSNTIPPNTVSAKYFDQHFDFQNCDPDHIKTPYFDSIFNHQDISGDILKWVYVFTGRLIYEIDELDGWQVIFFVQGQAGTGKSTYIMNVCKQLYDEEDVGVMSNNIQSKFGLSDLVDKLLYVAPEIKRDFSIEQGEFQSIVSGDKVTINIKCKSSRFENWKIPGIMAGNESPDFVDNSGSIQRRMISIKFNNKVIEGDLLLGKKLQEEMGLLLQKCNKYYLDYASKYGRKNIWTILPQYFANTRAEIAESTNALIHFLSSGKVKLDPESYIPEKVFINIFNQHCLDNNYKRCRFNKDFYTGPFSQYDIKVHKNEKKIYMGKITTTTFFYGVDIQEDDSTPQFESPEDNIL
jgi:phage/plasmid-associated DNA primase